MSTSFAAMHNDHLDPDIHDRLHAEDDKPDPPEMAWHLNLLQDGKETLLGIFSPFDGQDVMGCDMDEWMRENGHYGDESPDDYEWDGDSESVAIMAKREGMPEYRFEWRAISSPVPPCPTPEQTKPNQTNTTKLMNTTNHTPGPWLVQIDEDKNDPSFTTIKVVDGSRESLTHPQGALTLANIQTFAPHLKEGIANARLIAAAPDLLEALDWALRQIEDDLDPDHQAAFDAAFSTLRKSKGDLQ